jgi:hypothetical protein
MEEAARIFAEAIEAGRQPADAVRDLATRFPALATADLAFAIRQGMSEGASPRLASFAVARNAATAMGGPAAAAAMDVGSIVPDATYIAHLLRVARPATTPAEMAVALKDPQNFPALTAWQMSLVLHDAQVFPDLTAPQLTDALTAAAYSPADVKQAVDKMFPPPPSIDPALAAWWPLSSDAQDYSGHGRHGEFFGGRIVPGARGQSGAANLGQGAAIRVPRIGIAQSDFTFAAWVKLNETGSRSILFGDWVSYWQFLLAVVDGGRVAANLRRNINSGGSDPTQDLITLRTSPGVAAGQWCHVAVTWNRGAGVCTGYIGGAAAGSATPQPPNERDLQANNHPFYWIGRKEDSGDASSWLHGMISDVRLYTRALDAGEIGKLSQS